MENYKDIPGYEGLYQVSDLGNVRSLKRFALDKLGVKSRLLQQRILKPIKLKKGYLQVRLFIDGEYETIRIHQLVMMAFKGFNRCGMKLVIDHINDIKTDNRLVNLQIVSNRINITKNSKTPGVFFDKSRGKYRAGTSVNNKSVFIGRFETEEEAQKAYYKKRKELECQS